MDGNDVFKKMNWKKFWKEFDQWYSGHSWEKQRKELIRKLEEYIPVLDAKKLMNVFDLITGDVYSVHDPRWEEWENQAKLIEDLYKIFNRN